MREDLDLLVRLAAFEFLKQQSVLHRQGLPWSTLTAGFLFEGIRVPLVSQQGIFKPALLPEVPLSIRTAPIVEGRPRPYDDDFTSEGFVRYRYRGTDGGHRENVGLRLAMERRAPLVYFYGVAPGTYLAEWPAYIVGDDRAGLEFTVDLARQQETLPGGQGIEEEHARAYSTASVQRRLHQTSFRIRVLGAYRTSCAVCRLRHDELLDAAHILPDGHPRGEPWVSNGLSLCKLHHAAFDAHLLGIRPDLIVEIRDDVLDESDGPLLLHGLQECHRQKLRVIPSGPRLRPRAEFLEERYALFRRAG